MPASTVCISYASGAWGEEVGRLVAGALGFRYVDEEILIAAAEKEGLEPQQLAAVERHRSGLSRLQIDVVTGGAVDEVLRSMIRQSIRETGASGNVVIVAHAAAMALAGDERTLRVLVTASADVRAQRLAQAEQLDSRDAEKRVERSDKARAAYFKQFYDIDHELPVHYDLVVSTDRFSAERAAALIGNAAALVN